MKIAKKKKKKGRVYILYIIPQPKNTFLVLLLD